MGRLRLLAAAFVAIYGMMQRSAGQAETMAREEVLARRVGWLAKAETAKPRIFIQDVTPKYEIMTKTTLRGLQK